MKKAALYVHGRVVVGDNHGEAFSKLTQEEQNEDLLSGFFDSTTEEFDGEVPTDHFFNKDILLVRHATPEHKASEPDPNLTSLGVSQAEHLAEVLQGLDLSGFIGIASPFLRCLQTANILQQILRTKFVVDPMLAECTNFLQENEDYHLRNRCSSYPQFSWPSENEFVLRSESHNVFLERTLFVLQHLPHRSILVTHHGFICNITQLALCNEKACVVLRDGVPPASATHIHQQEVKALETYEKKHQDRPKTPH